MSDLLKAGATMLAESCPVCGSPLFKIGNEIRCSHCDKPVVFVKNNEDITKTTGSTLLVNLEETILTKLREINSLIKTEVDVDRLQDLCSLLSSWLEALEKIRKIQRS
jgi:UPF0148 protein